MMNSISAEPPQPPLPSEYQAVEWIQSTGTQYFVVPRVATLETELIIDGNFLGNGRFGYQRQSRFYLGVVSGKWACGIFGMTYYHNLGDYDQNRHMFSISKNGFYIDDVLKTTTSETSIDPQNLFYFASNFSGQPQYLATAKVYNIKLKEDGVDVVNLIPCYRIADDVIGMYDVVNDVFYTNQGTGTFLKGGDV